MSVPPPATLSRHKQLLLRTLLVSSLTLLSRIAGFVRESLAASVFGHASAINDAFVTAWRVPNLFRGLLGEGAMTTSLQTALTEEDAERGEAAGRLLFWRLVRFVLIASLLVTASVMLLAWLLPDVMPVTGWQWLGDHPAPVRELLLRMMPFVVFVALAAVLGGALQVRGHFASTALAPVLMNLWWIAALFLVIAHHPVVEPAREYERQFDMARELAWYLLVAGGLLVLVQLPGLFKTGLCGGGLGVLDTPPSAQDARVRAVWRGALPLAFGAAVYQINVMIGGLMAEGLLADGGPSILYYATRLQQLPLSLVAVAATSAVFPAMAAMGQAGQREQLRRLHADTQLAVVYVALPATVGLFVFAEPVMAVCFEHGAFGAEGVTRGAAALRGLAVAILPAGAVGLMARCCYAVGDLRTPVRVSVWALLMGIGLNCLFVPIMNLDVLGIALSSALGAWFNLALLIPAIHGHLGTSTRLRERLWRVARMLLCALTSVGVGFGVWDFVTDDRRSVLPLTLGIGVAIALYALMTTLAGLPEAKLALQRVGLSRSQSAGGTG
jgi:putative peptidoglycan lipid II flippase